ncbi:MAG: potassium transporter KefB [Bacteroidetes bacterium]|nr:MAG: potassium transporter KefB [Bacteroidota bacterium]
MPVFSDLIIILVVSAGALYLSSRLRLPSIVGFLVAGAVVGPHGVEMISTVDEVNVMAEIGVLLLLFSIGIEFSLDKLIEASRYVLLGGSLQVGLSILVFCAGAYLFGLSPQQAAFVGMLFAMSSTAIVLQLFQEKGWMNTVFGRAAVSILIFQDIIIIPMMMIAPYLSTNPDTEGESVGRVLLGLVLVVVVVIAARRIIPWLMRKIVHTQNQELFLISLIIICFATAFATKMLGLKLALGAFLAGLIISESEYSYEALKNIMPFKKIFTAIFFVSVGMLLGLGFVWENLGLLLGLTLVVMLIKWLLIVPVMQALKLGFRNAMISGLVLCQVGEFAFILSKTGLDYELLSTFTYQAFLSVSILSMVASALLIGQAPPLVDRLLKLPIWPSSLRKNDQQAVPAACTLADHTVIIGFGPGGRRIARHLAQQGVPLALIELNERNIQVEDHQYAQVFIGSATDGDVLKRAGIEAAKRVILTIPHVGTAEEVVTKVRKLNHEAEIVVRTKYVQETTHLHKLGATQVVPEELSVADAITAAMSR